MTSPQLSMRAAVVSLLVCVCSACAGGRIAPQAPDAPPAQRVKPPAFRGLGASLPPKVVPQHPIDYAARSRNAPLTFMPQAPPQFGTRFSPDGRLIVTTYHGAATLGTSEGQLLRNVGYIDLLPGDGQTLAGLIWKDGSYTLEWRSLEGELLESEPWGPVELVSRSDALLAFTDGRLSARGADNAVYVHAPRGAGKGWRMIKPASTDLYQGVSANGAVWSWYVEGEGVHSELRREDGTPISRLSDPPDPAHPRASIRIDSSFSADGRFVAMVDRVNYAAVWVWRTADGALVGHALPPPGAVGNCSNLALNDDGSLLAVTDSVSARLYKATGEYLGELEGSSFGDLGFSPDGEHVSAVGGIWSLRDGSHVTVGGGGGAGNASLVQYTRDGKAFGLLRGLFGGDRRSFDLWSADGRLTHSFALPEKADTWTFAADGKSIFVAVRATSTVFAFDLQGRTLRSFPGLSVAPLYLALSPSGTELYVGGEVAGESGPQQPGASLAIPLQGGPARALGGSGTGLAVSPSGDELATPATVLGLRGAAPAPYPEAARAKLQSTFPVDVAYSPDGTMIAVAVLQAGQSADLLLIDRSKGTLVADLPFFANKIAFSADSKLLAAGLGNEVALFSREGKELRRLRGQGGNADGLAFSPDGKQLAVTSLQAGVDLWNLKTFEHGLALSGGGEWVLVGDDGVFDASPRGGTLLAMVKGELSYSIDQFALKNNRPDELFKRLGFGTPESIDHYHAQWLRRLRRAGFSPEQIAGELQVPEARIVSAGQQGKVLALELSCADASAGLKAYNVFVNDVPLFGALGKPLSGKEAGAKEQVELAVGLNKVEVSCLNTRAGESPRALTTASYQAPLKPDLWFIGFGVSAYQKPELKLDYAAKDVRDLAALFGKMQPKEFGQVHVRELIDAQVTPLAVTEAAAFLQGAKVDDTVVLFIAGHGMHGPGKEAIYYYLGHAADPADLAGTAIDFSQLEGLLQGIAPRRKLFLMDTCESGELEEAAEAQNFAVAEGKGIHARAARGLTLKPAGAARPAAPRPFLAERDRFIYNDLQRRSGAIVFSSSRGGEFSYESASYQNGAFTKELLAALAGAADQDGDGQVSVDELRAQVSAAVPKLTEDKQHPTVDRDNVSAKFGFPVAR